MDVSAELFGIAQQYLQKVRKSGSQNVMALCPFHDDRTASFAMSLVTGVYFCHSCHAKGSLRTFFKELGLDRTATEYRHGLVIEAAAKNQPAPPDPLRPQHVWEETTRVIPESLLGLFDHEVGHLLPDFTAKTLQHFDIGWDGWHHRITFPIRDLKGQLVGISGRAVHQGQVPKYRIYDTEYGAWHFPPRLGWDKRATLWNSHEVYASTFTSLSPDQLFVVVVEGFKAGMWVWQAGITSVVALLGSYLSWEQGWILERMGAPVLLFLDNNRAGWSGQLDAAKRLTKTGLRVHIVEYPPRLLEDEDAQPDSLNKDEVVEQVARAPRYEEWLYKRRT
jgi:DNA primase